MASVCRTSIIEEMGGIAFLAQNSPVKKPFVVIGVVFMRSMGVDVVLAVKVGLKFDTVEWNHDTYSPYRTRTERKPQSQDLWWGRNWLETEHRNSESRSG